MARKDLLLGKTKIVQADIERKREILIKQVDQDQFPGFEQHELDNDFLESDKTTDDDTLDLLDDNDLTEVIRLYWSDIQSEVGSLPIMKLYIAGLYKMACEYTRIENQITDLNESVITLGNQAALTNERARIRDNMTTLTLEGWKLLGSVLESLHRVQVMLNKIKLSEGSDSDPFETFLSGE